VALFRRSSYTGLIHDSQFLHILNWLLFEACTMLLHTMDVAFANIWFSDLTDAAIFHSSAAYDAAVVFLPGFTDMNFFSRVFGGR
jgi:hypothetical protein